MAKAKKRPRASAKLGEHHRRQFFNKAFEELCARLDKEGEMADALTKSLAPEPGKFDAGVRPWLKFMETGTYVHWHKLTVIRDIARMIAEQSYPARRKWPWSPVKGGVS
jgi:hypothetical protein